MDGSFVAYNADDDTKSMRIHHRCSLCDCTCTEVDNNTTCTAYAVGYHLKDLCTALGLNPLLPIHLSADPARVLEVVDCEVVNEPTIIIPLHKTSSARRGFRNMAAVAAPREPGSA